MRIVFLLVLQLLALSAQAALLKFDVVELRSPAVNTIREIRLYPNSDGTLTLIVDPNHCGNPGPCTHLAIRKYEINPVVMEDHRKSGGYLFLHLTGEIILRVDSGDNSAQLVHYVVLIGHSDGTQRKVSLQLNVDLLLQGSDPGSVSN